MQFVDPDTQAANNEMSDAEMNVQMYTKLNKAGRGQLLEGLFGNKNNVASYLWITAIGDVSDDLNCLFYLIRMNPILCSYAGSVKTDAPSGIKRSRQENDPTASACSQRSRRV